MLEINILEGARGTGKSTISFKLRQKIGETTLINFTGFNEEGFDGKMKSYDYYSAFMKLLYELKNHDSKMVFDRFFFSERVFSELYKDYDFSQLYELLSSSLVGLAYEGVKINIFFFTIDDENELKSRLTRDKIPFGKVEESVTQSMLQQELYKKVFSDFEKHTSNVPNINVHTIDTTYKTLEEIYDEAVERKGWGV